jgi:hypothetical protein
VRYADVLRQQDVERFWVKVDRKAPDQCWLWLGGHSNEGYGQFSQSHGFEKRRTLLAHRVSYDLLVGSVPTGLHLDHLCRTRGCVNPAHLEPVTCRENLLRGATLQAQNARKTHCIHGHPFTPENTYVPPLRRNGLRACRQCRQDQRRRAAA